MLTYLANEDMDVFNELSNLSPELTAHLKGYNLIDENDGNYYFKIESIKEYLRKKNKYKAKLKTPEERWKEISERRNKLEVKLRQLVRMQMQSNFGKTEAFNKVINIYGADRKNKHTGCEYMDLFNPDIVKVYFIDLQKIIIKYYDDVFKNIFGSNKDEIKVALDTINKYRSDAHAKNIEVEEMDFFRVNISKIEKIVYDFI
jgi:DNA-binding transcriptional MerR regulator